MVIPTIGNLIQTHANDPLKLLQAIDGFYECKKDKATGKRLTPMVGYAGKYNAGDGKELQYVGDVYANFAKAEEHPAVLFHYTKILWEKMRIPGPIVFVGPQMGGIAIGEFMALHASEHTSARYACAEKKIIQLKTEKLREQSELQFARHGIQSKDRVIITEDVLNNFSTTQQIIELVEKHGGEVIAIAGLLNRSMTIGNSYEYKDSHIPVIPLIHKPYPEYKQDVVEVINDIEARNVVLKPKDEWEKLMGIFDSVEKI